LAGGIAVKVFFDVDGVLIDDWHAAPDRRKPWDATIEQDLGVHREAFKESFFRSPTASYESLMHGCAIGALDLKEALASILPAAGYGGSVDAFVAYWFEKDSNVNRSVLDVADRLARHSDVDLYLATNQEHYRAAYLWEELDLRRHFIDIFYSAKLGHSKATQAFFEKVNAELGVSPTEKPLFFDDKLELVRVARNAGWDACVFETVQDLTEHPRLKNLLRP